MELCEGYDVFCEMVISYCDGNINEIHEGTEVGKAGAIL